MEATPVGREFFGRVADFRSAPRLGGYVKAETVLTSLVRGFVDPTNGTPRVHLEVYRKKR